MHSSTVVHKKMETPSLSKPKSIKDLKIPIDIYMDKNQPSIMPIYRKIMGSPTSKFVTSNKKSNRVRTRE